MKDINRKGYLFSNHDLAKLILPLVIEQLLAICVGMADTVMIAAAFKSEAIVQVAWEIAFVTSGLHREFRWRNL